MNKKITDGYKNLSKKIGTNEGVVGGSYFSIATDTSSLEEEFNHDGLMNAIVTAPIVDAFLTGIESDDIKIVELFNSRKKEIIKAITVSRALGGAFLYFLEDKIVVFSENELSLGVIELNKLRDDYLSFSNIEVTNTGAILDMEKVMIIREESTDEYLETNNSMGVSITEKARENLIRYTSSLDISTDILAELNQSVIMLDGLNLALEDGRESDISDRLATINLLKSNMSTIALDGEDSFHNISKSVNGATDITKQNALAICAVAKIPYTRLFGDSKTGLSQSNKSDLENYYDTVVSDIRSLYVEPIFNRLLKEKNLTSSWEFKSLISKADIEKAQEMGVKIDNAIKLNELGLVSEEDMRGIIGLT